MIVERKVKEGDIRFYAYVGCFPGGDILLVDRDGKLSVTSHHSVIAVAGKVELVRAHYKKVAESRRLQQAQKQAFGSGVGEIP